MLLIFLLSFPMSLLWMIFARQFSPEGFIVGYCFGFAIVLVIRVNTSEKDRNQPVFITKIPGQIISLIIYIIRLAIDVFLSGLDVAGRVLRPSLPISPDVQRVETQDATNNLLISALSAHSITITPGELVIDFEEEDGKTIMLVHTLDRDASDMNKLTRDQTNRLQLIRRILGLDAPQEGD